MVKLTKWTKFLTDYHKKSGNAKLSKSMKEASPLYKKHNGKTGKTGKIGKHGKRKRGGEPAPQAGAQELASPTPTGAQELASTGGGEEVVPAEGVQPDVSQGGRSRKRKGSNKSKTRRR